MGSCLWPESSINNEDINYNNGKVTVIGQGLKLKKSNSLQKPIQKIDLYPIAVKTQNQGLPNLGNTCFLNSIIQSLFSLKQFRKYTIMLNSNNPVITSLGNVFKSLQQILPLKQKKYYMEKLISCIVQKDKDFNYSGSSQQDAIHFLTFILYQLGLQQQMIKEFFHIIFIQYCNNTKCKQYKQKQKISETFLKILDQKCPCCQFTKHKQILKAPKYLIIIKNQQNNLKLMSCEHQTIYYTVLSKILYSGNGNFGHYICKRRLYSFAQKFPERQYFNEWSLYNDSLIQKDQILNSFKINCCFYQKIELALVDTKQQQDKKCLQNSIKRSNNSQNQKQSLGQKKIKPNQNQQAQNKKQKQNSLEQQKQCCIIRTFKKVAIIFNSSQIEESQLKKPIIEQCYKQRTIQPQTWYKTANASANSASNQKYIYFRKSNTKVDIRSFLSTNQTPLWISFDQIPEEIKKQIRSYKENSS